MKKINLTMLSGKFLSLALIVTMLGFVACGDDEGTEPTPVTENIYELMSADADLSELKGFIDSFGLASAIQSSNATTFFAPDNAAFEKLRQTLGTDDLSTVADAIIESVLRFHVVEGAALTAADLVAAGSASTNQGESIVVNTGASNSGTIATGGSDTEVEILKVDIEGTNGFMHVIETILIPPTIFQAIGINLGKLSQPLLLGSDFTILAAGIAKADAFAAGASLPLLTDVLSGSDTYTVFAPTNATFEAGSVTLDTFTGQQWYGIIANHVVPGSVAPADLITCATFPTAAMGELEIFFNTAVAAANVGLGIFIDSNGNMDCTLADMGASLGTGIDAEVVAPDVFAASNGRLHVIAGILVP